MGTKIGIIGSGVVGQSLAKGFVKHGYDVTIGSNDPKKRDDLKSKTNANVGSFEETAKSAALVVLAVKGEAAEAAITSAGFANLAGKTIIDTTNPIADAPPVNGVLKYFTSLDDSLMERLQKLVPEAHFVKAFNSVGNGTMVHPSYAGTRPTMFIAGNDTGAKDEVSAILGTLGWDVEDMGTAAAARAIEPLCMLWCIPGMRGGSWTHAFKLLRG